MSTPTIVFEKGAVQSVLEAWITGVEQDDLGLISQVVAHDEDVMYIGSGTDERIMGWSTLKAALEAQAAALSDIHITASEVTIHPLCGGQAAWATSLWTFEARMGDQALSVPLRCTWIAEKREAGWVLVHFHKSVGMAG